MFLSRFWHVGPPHLFPVHCPPGHMGCPKIPPCLPRRAARIAGRVPTELAPIGKNGKNTGTGCRTGRAMGPVARSLGQLCLVPLKWDYTTDPPGYYDAVHASPTIHHTNPTTIIKSRIAKSLTPGPYNIIHNEHGLSLCFMFGTQSNVCACDFQQ